MESELRNMVMAFRVTELQTLLNYAGKQRTGRKNELQQRALDLVKGKPGHIVLKVKELYKTIQMQTMSQPQPASAGIPNPHSSSYSASNNINRLYTGSSGYGGASDNSLQGRNPFSVFNGLQPKIPGLTALSVPFCPDVRLKRLPFYDVMSELIKPTNLFHGSSRILESSFPFYLTPQQAADVASSKEFMHGPNGDQKIQYTVQIQLRFCLSDSSADQDDCFPPSIMVKLNGKTVPLPHPIPSNRPGVEPKRPSRPLNVTNYAKLSPVCSNTITVQWATDTNNRTYAITLHLVKKLCSGDLLARLKSKGVRPSEFTKGMIKEIVLKDEADCQIATTSFKVSIACPLGKCRMTLPCRASTCSHLQCFDANLYLQMNEKKPSWNCPVCDKATLFENLSIDGYFQEVLQRMSDTPSYISNDIEILPDGSWNPIIAKKSSDEGPPVKRVRQAEPSQNETICIDDDLIIEEDISFSSKRKSEPITLDPDNDSDCAVEESSKPSGSSSNQSKSSKRAISVECITIDDSDEEPEPEPEPQQAAEEEEEEEEEVVRTLRPRNRKNNAVYIDESSSSSSTTNGGSVKMGENSNPSPASPACITLDSPSPSPELRIEQNSNSNEGPTNSTAAFNYGSLSSSSTNSNRTEASTSGNNYSSNAPSCAYNTRLAASAQASAATSSENYSSTASTKESDVPTASAFSAQHSQGYTRYDTNWSTPQPQPGTYQGATDYNLLDYHQSMDYFTHPSYNARNGSGGGSYNWP